MEEKPGASKSSHNISRHTIVMRRAKDEDAQRLADSDAGEQARSSWRGEQRPDKTVSARGNASARSGNATARSGGAAAARNDASARSEASAHGKAPAREGSETSRRSRSGRMTSSSARTVSGRTVVVHREGEVSGRLRMEGDRASSVRVTGGDTIIRYESGDMVIRRGARRAQIRRQLLMGYAAGYIVLFGLYMYFLFACTYSLSPEAFVSRVFAMRHGSSEEDLRRAAIEEARSSRTPAEVRLAQALSFYDASGEMVQIEAGTRLTLATAVKLGKAILNDMEKDPGKRSFQQPIRLFNESYIANMNWPHWLTVYNSLGFFLLVGLFLWRPILNYLGTQGKKTEAAVQYARLAQEEAREYREKYRRLAAETSALDERLRGETAEAIEANRETVLADARKRAEGMEGGIREALDREAEALAVSLGNTAAAAACERARELLSKRLGPAEHDAAIDALIADIAGLRQA